MYKYKSTCRFKMLIYTDSGIVEVRPQQVLEFETTMDHPYLQLIEDAKPKKTYKPRKKKETVTDGERRQSDN